MCSLYFFALCFDTVGWASGRVSKNLALAVYDGLNNTNDNNNNEISMAPYGCNFRGAQSYL